LFSNSSDVHQSATERVTSVPDTDNVRVHCREGVTARTLTTRESEKGRMLPRGR